MQRVCANSWCQQPFEITPDDLAFYEKVSPIFNGKKELIPPPTLCPECRWQRRLTFRNERTFYRRTCDLDRTSILSTYPSSIPFPVYDAKGWCSDQWDPLTYGCDYRLDAPLLEQITQLWDVVPHPSLARDPRTDENSDYTNCSAWAKNCYLISQAEYNENCYYARGINHCRDCCDCLRITDSELCYECVNVSRCYRSFYCQDCDNTSECFFSSELRGCRNCFGCHGLSQKEYYLFNKPMNEREWQNIVPSLHSTHIQIRNALRQSQNERSRIPQRAAHLIQCEGVTGDHILQSRNSHQVFDSQKLENCKYCYELPCGAKDCMDYSMWGDGELLYECSECGTNAYQCMSCIQTWQNVQHMYYCLFCSPGCSSCFGCIGLKHKQYCILNKQYMKEEYEQLAPKIIEKMRANGEWGEFFPASMSPFGYNETVAQEYFPLTKEQALERGFTWSDYEAPMPKVEKTIQASDLPDSIDDIPDDILNWAVACEATKKPFKIIKRELDFYRKMQLPIPHFHPDERHRRRMALRNPRKLWERNCANCKRPITTSYSPDRPEIVYCEECYLKEVY